MVKHLFSDIDGTLLQNNKIDDVTLIKINNFIQAGNKFYLATGRIDSDIVYIIDNYLKCKVDYRISQNGTIINDYNNNVIYKNYLDLSNINLLLQYLGTLDSTKVLVEVSDDKNRYSNKPRLNNTFFEFNDIIIVEPNLYNIIGSTVFPTVILLMCKDYNYIKQVQSHINKTFTNITAVMTSEYLLEIINITSSKGTAINKLITLHNINKNDVYVVGDNENDISMFTEFKNSFVINTAKEHVKAKANYMVSNVGQVIDSIK